MVLQDRKSSSARKSMLTASSFANALVGRSNKHAQPVLSRAEVFSECRACADQNPDQSRRFPRTTVTIGAVSGVLSKPFSLRGIFSEISHA